MGGPLSGVRVVEMSAFAAGPVAAGLLADLGYTDVRRKEMQAAGAIVIG